MGRLLVVALGLCATSFVQAQDLPQKFTFRRTAGSAAVVLAELSKASGAKLVASPDVANDVILISVKDATINDTMNRIAETLHSQWREEGSGWVLYRGSNFQAMDRRQEASERVALLRERVKGLLGAQKAAGAFREQADAGKAAARGVNPASRAIAGILARMSDAQIAQIVDRPRNVFTSSPTRMQYPLPNGTHSIATEYLQDQLWLHALKQKNESKKDLPTMYMVGGFREDSMGEGDPKLGIGHTMLIALVDSIKSSVKFSLTLHDPNGQPLCTGSLSVALTESAKKPSVAFLPTENEKPIEFSAESREIVTVLEEQGKGRNKPTIVAHLAQGVYFLSEEISGSTPPLSADLRERILNPETHDPLSFSLSEGILESARQLDRNVVAYLPDSAFFPLAGLAKNSNLKPSQFLNTLQSHGRIKIKDADRWLLISPQSPALERERSVNRLALGKALKTLARYGNLTLDQLAEYASSQSKEPSFYDFDLLYFSFVDGPFVKMRLNLMNAGGLPYQWKTLQLYNSFSAMQKRTVAESGQVPLSTFSNQQFANLTDQVFGAEDGPAIALDVPPGLGDYISKGWPVFTAERTYVLANGLQRDGYVQFTNSSSEGLQAKSSISQTSRFIPSSLLAILQVFDENTSLNAKLASFLNDFERPNLFRSTQVREFGFKFFFSPQVSMTRQLSDVSISNPSYVPFAKLPTSIRKRIEDDVAKLRTIYGGGF